MKKDIIKLFELKGVIVDKMEIKKDILVYARSPRIRAMCPLCGKSTNKIHQRKTRKVIHGILNNKRIVLVIKTRRFKCLKCMKPFTEQNIPGVSRHRFSENFQLKSLSELTSESFKNVSLKYKISSPSLVRFLKERRKEIIWPHDKEIILNIDEHSYSGRDMKITIGDIKRKRLLAVLKDDRQETLNKFLKSVPNEVKSKISEVCIDMKMSYKNSIEKNLPNSLIVIDKFHVIRELLRQMEETRKILQEVNNKNKRINRFLLLKNKESLNFFETLKLKSVFKDYENFPTLKNCYLVKEKIREVYKCKNPKIAEYKFDLLLKILEDEKVGKLKEVRETLKRWRPYILNYFKSRTTNAFIEGMNNKIKLIKRVSFGFRNFENYVLKITLAFMPFLFLVPNLSH